MVNNIGYGGGYYPGFSGGFGGGANCICSLPTLVILILIVLQFSRCGHGCHRDYDE